MGKFFLVLTILLKQSKQDFLTLGPYLVASGLSMLCHRGDYQCLSSTATLTLPPSMFLHFELATMRSRKGVKREKMEVV